MADIVLDKKFVTALAKRLKKRFGPAARHTDILDDIAAALGWKTDALMHRLKTDAAQADSEGGVASDSRGHAAHVDRQKIEARVADLLRTAAEEGMKPIDMTPEPGEPALDDRGTIWPNALLCLEDGKLVIMLHRHVRAKFGLEWKDYLKKHGLPDDYPQIAPGYRKTKQGL